METIDPHAVGSHYSQGQLAVRLTEALRLAGKNPDAPTTADLAGVDEFHVRGREATLELANLARLRRGARVLDVGGGIGGPARTLASEFGCSVEVLDITEEFVAVGESLTERTGLGDRVTFRLGSALAMPYPDRSFEVVWSQHSSMNIAAKETLYREMSRVLQPRGTLAIYEIMAGPVRPIHFPVPWARVPDIISLVSPDRVRELIESFGLRQLLWNDATAVSREWIAARLSAAGPPMPLGLHVILGSDLKPMMENVVRNFDERRMVAIQGVFARP